MVKVTASYIGVYNSNHEVKSVMVHNNHLKPSTTDYESDSSISFDDSSDEEETKDDMLSTIKRLKEANKILNRSAGSNNVENTREEKMNAVKKRFQTSSPPETLYSPRMTRKQFSLNTREIDIQPLPKRDRPNTLDLDTNQQRRRRPSTQVEALCSPIISRKQFRKQQTVEQCYEGAIQRSCSTSQINILYSPRLTRKNFIRSKGLLSASITSLTSDEDSPMSDKLSVKCSPGQYQLQSDKSLNPEVFSTRTKRKQFDITKSPAYKEIYAHNLRLYSAVLAKQIASTGQVGREMDELRRNKIKEKALQDEKIPRSRSFAAGEHLKSCNTGLKSRQERSNSAGTTDLYKASLQIRNKFLSKRSLSQDNNLDSETSPLSESPNNGWKIGSLSPLLTSPDESSEANEEMYDESRPSAYRSEITSSDAINNVAKNTDGVTNNHVISNAYRRTTSCMEVCPRRKAATLRSEYFRKKISSFDETMIEANRFLNKIKSIKGHAQQPVVKEIDVK